MESRTPRPKRKSVKRKYEYDDSENNRISETQFTKVNLNTRINYCNKFYNFDNVFQFHNLPQFSI